MNQKGFITPLIVIILIIAALIGGYAAVRRQKAKNEKISASPAQNPYANAPQLPVSTSSPAQNPPANLITAIPADWKTYRNEKYGFMVSYPTNLRASQCRPDYIYIGTDNELKGSCDYEPEGGGRRIEWPHISIEIADNSTTSSDIAKVWIGEDMSEFQGTATQSEFILGGQKAAIIRGNSPGTAHKVVKVILSFRGYTYRLSYSESVHTGITTFGSMLSTFKFER